MHFTQWIGLEYREKYTRRYEGKCDVFFGIELRLRNEDMEEQFNREAKEGWRFAADAARITDERASSEDRKHTSGGVFVAVDSNLGPVVGTEEGAIVSIPGNEGSIAQAWVNVRGCLRVFRCISGTQKVGPRGMRRCLRQWCNRQKTTTHPWLAAGDANMSPEDSEKNPWFRRERMHVVAPKEASTCRSNGPKVGGLKEHMTVSLREVSGEIVY